MKEAFRSFGRSVVFNKFVNYVAFQSVAQVVVLETEKKQQKKCKQPKNLLLEKKTGKIAFHEFFCCRLQTKQSEKRLQLYEINTKQKCRTNSIDAAPFDF